MAWPNYVPSGIKDAVTTCRDRGWTASKTAARLAGEDGNWSQAFLHLQAAASVRTFYFHAGSYSPLLQQLFGLKPAKGRTPSKRYWLTGSEVQESVTVQMVSAIAARDRVRVLADPFGRVPVRLTPDDFGAWFGSAFDAVREHLEMVASDQGLLDWRLANLGDIYNIRETILLAAGLGQEERVSGLVERVNALAEEHHAAMLTWYPGARGLSDRSNDPLNWSHKRFLKQLDQARQHTQT